MKPIYAKPALENLASFQIRKDEFNVLDTKWHYHSEYELTYICYPHGKSIAGGSIQLFEGGDLVLYGPNLPHAWAHEDVSGATGEEPTETRSGYAIVVHFAIDSFGEHFFKIPEMSGIANILDKSSRGLSIHGESKERIIQMMKEMLQLSGASRVILLLQIFEELAKGQQFTLLSSTGYWENLNDNDSVRMSNIYEYIVHNYTQDIRLEEVANKANISSSAFCRYFKARTKKTLKEFINDLRINYACQLLEENKLSITQIGFEAGFNNISNFNRRFKEIKKVTPQKYKSNILGLNVRED